MDLLAFTAETFLNWRCHEALVTNRRLKARILIRDVPEGEPKFSMASASLHFIAGLEVAEVQVRAYEDVPLLRAVIFDRSRGYLGLYRWDDRTHFKFIGAENNALISVDRDQFFGRLWLDLYLSRFDFEWQRARRVGVS